MDNPAQSNLVEQQSSRHKRKKSFILLSIIFFTLTISAIISIFSLLKHHAHSQTLSHHQACRFTAYPPNCRKYLSSLHTLHPTDVLQFSIELSHHKLLLTHHLIQQIALKPDYTSIKPSLTECQNLLNKSINQLNYSMAMITIAKNDRERVWDYNDDEGMIKELRDLVDEARGNVNMCINGLPQNGMAETKSLKRKMQYANMYVWNSLSVLENMESIRGFFYPRVQGVLASFLLERENYVLSIVVFCSQYLVVVFLFCLLLRVHK